MRTIGASVPQADRVCIGCGASMAGRPATALYHTPACGARSRKRAERRRAREEPYLELQAVGDDALEGIDPLVLDCWADDRERFERMYPRRRRPPAAKPPTHDRRFDT